MEAVEAAGKEQERISGESLNSRRCYLRRCSRQSEVMDQTGGYMVFRLFPIYGI